MTYGFTDGVLPPNMPPVKKTISLALRGRIRTVGPDRMATTGGAGHSGFPTGGGPEVPEKEISPATGSGVLWHARGLEMAACPEKLKDSPGIW